MDNNQSIWTLLNNPFLLLILGGIVTYLTGKALNAAQIFKTKADGSKTEMEAVILTADKVDELTNTIYLLRNSLNDLDGEMTKLKVTFDLYKEGCEEVKSAIRDFIQAYEVISKNVGDQMILDQVESLKRKVK